LYLFNGTAEKPVGKFLQFYFRTPLPSSGYIWNYQRLTTLPLYSFTLPRSKFFRHAHASPSGIRVYHLVPDIFLSRRFSACCDHAVEGLQSTSFYPKKKQSVRLFSFLSNVSFGPQPKGGCTYVKLSLTICRHVTIFLQTTLRTT
jgi:hypothetical protein